MLRCKVFVTDAFFVCIGLALQIKEGKNLTISMVTSSAVMGTKAGLCPHGLPFGACPICSGMGGGGAKMKTADFSAKPGEMSWNECAAIGAFLRAQKLAAQNRDADYNNHVLALAKFQSNLSLLSAKLADFIKTATANRFVAPAVNVAKAVILPVVNLLKNVPSIISNLSANLTQKFVDITDKLTAVFGELKAKIDKKISDSIKAVKKKILSIFQEIFPVEELDDNENKIEDEKRIFELKTLLTKIYSKLKDMNYEQQNQLGYGN